MVAGAVVAGAAAIVGAVWAITAIVDDDDYSAVDYATSLHREDLREDEFGWGPPGRDGGERKWGERNEQRRSEQFERGNGDRYERDRRERAEGRRQERQERREQREREEREERERAERDREAQSKRDGSADPGLPLAGDECKTILSLGTGDDAVTVLICNAPGDEWPGFEPRDNGGYFKFRDFPREAFPFFGMRSEQWPFEGRPRPFGPGMAPWDRDGKPLEDGGRPFSDLDELSDEEREQLERMMEMLDGFGLEGLFGGLEEFLDGLELEFGESQVEPSGVTGA